FTEYYMVQPTNPVEPQYQVFLHTNSYIAPLSSMLSADQFKSALNKLEQQDGVDILTAPEVTTESMRQCEVQAVDMMNVIVGPPTANGQPTASPSSNFFQLASGPVVDVIPHVSADLRAIHLTIKGTVTEFVGYENPATVTNSNGKPMPKGWAI